MVRASVLVLGCLLFPCLCVSAADEGSGGPIRVVVWDEQQPAQKQAYENFLGNAIADYLKARPGLSVTSVRLDDAEQGLSKSVLDGCDVLIWWGHVRQREIKRETGQQLVDRIKAGKLSMISLWLRLENWERPTVLFSSRS